MIARTLALLVGFIVETSAGAQTPPAPLVLEAKIPLGSISGRIDHLAIDPKRKWLFVAELGNDSLGVVNLVAGKVLRTITGLSEPQGVGYEPITDAVYVANARGQARRGAAPSNGVRTPDAAPNDLDLASLHLPRLH